MDSRGSVSPATEFTRMDSRSSVSQPTVSPPFGYSIRRSIWADNSSALLKDPERKQSRLKREVYKVYRPETPEEIIEDEVEVGRCERRCLRILTGALLACLCCSLLGSALMMMMWLNCLSQDPPTAATASTTVTTATTTTATTTTTTTTATTATSTTTTTSTTSTATTTTTTTTTSTYCITTSITAGISTHPMPPQCFNATLIEDGTRSAGYYIAASGCDQQGPLGTAGWFNFTGPGGMILANCPVAPLLCGTGATGWYSGIYPGTPGQTLDANACFNWNGNQCNWLTSIKATNCNGYYVFYLIPPPYCFLRYCTV